MKFNITFPIIFNEMASTSGTKELKTNWPIESGLTAGTTKQAGRTSNLVPEVDLVAKRLKVGID